METPTPPAAPRQRRPMSAWSDSELTWLMNAAALGGALVFGAMALFTALATR